MIEAAAEMYCRPNVDYTMQTYQAEGRNVLVAYINESPKKPVYAKDETNRYLAYLRIKDENILASPIHLRIWQQNKKNEGELIAYTEREQLLLNLLKENNSLSLNRYCKLAHLSRRVAENLLAKLVRFGVVEAVFEEHKFLSGKVKNHFCPIQNTLKSRESKWTSLCIHNVLWTIPHCSTSGCALWFTIKTKLYSFDDKRNDPLIGESAGNNKTGKKQISIFSVICHLNCQPRRYGKLAGVATARHKDRSYIWMWLFVASVPS